MDHNLTQIKSLPAPSVKKLLRERGFRYPTVQMARIAGCNPSHVSRVIRKQATSDPVWSIIADCIDGRVRPVEPAGVV